MNDSQHRPSDMRVYRQNYDAVFRKPQPKIATRTSVNPDTGRVTPAGTKIYAKCPYCNWEFLTPHFLGDVCHYCQRRIV